ncbi:hypothetical protein PVAP13_9NG494100 [Panicum virgatum]|uniref:Glutathione S-transferase n=1 Tax=Panicum virgatum TaxID=38727 RepID=A0A8T0MRX4_PANVG|nr:hypothetical protein PVAP13_9NG494100 [Panicum virgatum]
MAANGGGGDLKLLGVWDSPYVNRVQIVLNLKGLSYEYVEEDLLHKSALLLESNPVHGKVPCLSTAAGRSPSRRSSSSTSTRPSPAPAARPSSPPTRTSAPPPASGPPSSTIRRASPPFLEPIGSGAL